MDEQARQDQQVAKGVALRWLGCGFGILLGGAAACWYFVYDWIVNR
jgi:hypothetical protein